MPPVPLVSLGSLGAAVTLFSVVAVLAYVVLADLLGAGREADDATGYVEGPGGRGTRDRPRERDLPTPATRAGDPPGGPWWRRLGYATLLGWLALLTWPVPVAALDVVLSADVDVLVLPALAWLGAFGLVAALVRVVLVPAFLWRDVTTVRRAEVEWYPSRLGYVVGAVVLGTLVSGYYLYKRHQRFDEPPLPSRLAGAVAYRGPVRSNWWYLVAFDLVAVLAPTAVEWDAVGRVVGRLPDPVALPLYNLWFLLGAGVLLAVLLLPVAFWKDARAVRAADVSWSPHPLLLAVGGVLLFVLVGPYYLGRRILVLDREADPGQSQTTR